MAEHKHLNFPDKLAISPLLPHHAYSTSAFLDEQQVVFGAEAQREGIETYGIAGRVWEAAYLMTSYIDHPSTWEFDPPLIDKHSSGRKRVFLELGSGTGIVAAKIAQTAALCGRDLVIATDLPEVCPLLEKNLFVADSANTQVALVRPLSWGSYDHAINIARELKLVDESNGHEHGCITHIICSDLVYFPELMAPLLRTLLHLTSLPSVSIFESQPRIIISYKIRSLSKETPFWSAFGLWFSFEPVVVRKIDANNSLSEWQRFGSDTGDDGDLAFIFVARRRSESLNWMIPSEDIDLLGGVGAKGTCGKKYDETFETLLLMGLGE
ncbi:putative methyltransferase-domain-containing protein [Suillus clintonianus]|uniref:putative methyltransferase-domain-containing protein n=1 Tax=Suillus clintonianus TaxID=1904413 RepID=UPI001B869773|nr:putative methyltransferase-domain-containing protein [Suillus clintonianus]KAG2122798.1 putative methyltransferase-domain-containing protein [Suillus clintonianus]